MDKSCTGRRVTRSPTILSRMTIVQIEIRNILQMEEKEKNTVVD